MNFINEHNIDVLTYNKLQEKATALTNISLSLGKCEKPFSYDNIKSAENEFKAAGMDLNQNDRFTKLVSLASSTAANDVGNIGQNTYQISNQLIQDISPENKLAESPFSEMLPYRAIDAVEYQQDIVSSNYGNAQAANGVNGANNIVPILTQNGIKFEGYDYVEESFLSGRELIALREGGNADTTIKGATQRLTLQRLLLLARQEVGIELNRIDALCRGSTTYGNQTAYQTFSQQLLAGNIGQLSESLGTYTNSTNSFARNTGMTIDPLVELGNFLTPIFNAGLKIKEIITDNITWNAIFNCASVQSKTIYTSAVSGNNVMNIRDNLFRLTTIPALQGVPLTVYNGSWKLNANRTTTANTRPMMWGAGAQGTNALSSSAFRAIVVVEQSGMSRVGDLGFFPNQYMRTAAIGGGSREIASYGGGGIALIQQDLSVMDITNQKIQMLAAATYQPMVYLQNMVYLWDWNVTVV